MRSAEKYIGQKFGRLTVVALSERRSSDRSRYFICNCECGKVNHEVIGRSVRTGMSKSCGCLAKQRAKETHTIGGIAIVNRHEAYYKSGAFARQYEYQLNREQYRSIVFQSCHYCGFEGKVARELNYNGIDRIDNTKGYVLANCVPCCTNCNFAKKDMPYADFIQYLNRIVKFRRPYESKD